MRFNRPVIVESEEPSKLSRLWPLITNNKITLAFILLFIVFFQFKEFFQAAIAAALAAISFMFFYDLFMDGNDGHTSPYIDEMGALIFAGVIFLSTWIACSYAYGFLFGFGLGWLPAYILSCILGYAWRIISLIAVLALLWITLAVV